MKVLNFGSLNIDRVYKVVDFVQPGETVLSADYQEFCGGKGLNQSIALARAGVSVYHAGAVGGDGEQLKRALEEAGVKIPFLQVLQQPSGHAVIEVDKSGQNRIIVTAGTNGRIREDYIDGVLEYFEKGDILLLQNEISTIPYIIKRAKASGMQIVLNPSPVNEALYEYPLDLVDIFILNEKEGTALAGVTECDPGKILDCLEKKYPESIFVLTLGADGVCYRGKGEHWRQEAFPVKVVDTTAAGDTFCGYFLAEYVNGKKPAEALLTATRASAIAVGRNGASPSIPTMGEVEDLFQ